MMHKTRWWLILLLVGGLLGLTSLVTAQNAPTATPTPVNPNANITWPLPVYVLRGQFEVRGSANLPNMTSYFVEFRPLAEDLSVPDEDAFWLPATLPSTSAVQDDVLGVWDTRTTPDGLYELRLTINVSGGGAPVSYRVAPLRVENNPPPFAVIETAVPTVPTLSVATLQPTPTAFDTTPRATATRDANVRRGDSTSHAVIGSLPAGTTVPIVGVSSLGTGWYLITLPNGTRGWVAPSVVTVEGNISGVPRVDPPPPPTATPIPFTATPASAINLVAGNFSFNPPSPRCNETFNVTFQVANQGSQTSFNMTVSIQDFRVADNTFQGGNSVGVGPIAPGQTVDVVIPVKISTYYNEQHRLFMQVDSGNAVFEFNEQDNARDAFYTLEKAACP